MELMKLTDEEFLKYSFYGSQKLKDYLCRNGLPVRPFIEMVLRSVKYGKIYLLEFEDVPELLTELKIYFVFYNLKRPHQSLVGITLG